MFYEKTSSFSLSPGYQRGKLCFFVLFLFFTWSTLKASNQLKLDRRPLGLPHRRTWTRGGHFIELKTWSLFHCTEFHIQYRRGDLEVKTLICDGRRVVFHKIKPGVNKIAFSVGFPERKRLREQGEGVCLGPGRGFTWSKWRPTWVQRGKNRGANGVCSHKARIWILVFVAYDLCDLWWVSNLSLFLGVLIHEVGIAVPSLLRR